MKHRLYIILISLGIITVFTYGTNYTISNPSVKTTQKIINKEVLCLNISLISIDYIDSLVVKNTLAKNKKSQVFVFNPNTRRISVECFYEICDINNKELEIVVFKSGKEYRYKNNLNF